MEKIDLHAKTRTAKGRQVKPLRLQGLIPAVVYGREIDAQAITVENKIFQKAISGEAGTNIIISLKIEGQKSALPVLTKEIQRNALTDEILHVDFRNISMTEKIKTMIPVELLGIPLGVKDEGGVLVHGLSEIEVECLPMDIPDKFEIEVTDIMINQSKHVSDLVAPNGVDILSNKEEPVAMVKPPTKEEEVAPPTELAEGEVPLEGAEGAVPAEGVEGAEGAPAKEGAAKGAEKGAEKGAAKGATDKKPAGDKKADAGKGKPGKK